MCTFRPTLNSCCGTILLTLLLNKQLPSMADQRVGPASTSLPCARLITVLFANTSPPASAHLSVRPSIQSLPTPPQRQHLEAILKATSAIFDAQSTGDGRNCFERAIERWRRASVTQSIIRESGRSRFECKMVLSSLCQSQGRSSGRAGAAESRLKTTEASRGMGGGLRLKLRMAIKGIGAIPPTFTSTKVHGEKNEPQ